MRSLGRVNLQRTLCVYVDKHISIAYRFFFFCFPECFTEESLHIHTHTHTFVNYYLYVYTHLRIYIYMKNGVISLNCTK